MGGLSPAEEEAILRRLSEIGQVSFQWKNSGFVLKNGDFLLKNGDFII